MPNAHITTILEEDVQINHPEPGPTHQTHRFVQVCYTPGLVIILICKIIIFGVMRSGHLHATNGPQCAGSHTKTTLSEGSQFWAHLSALAAFTLAQMNCTCAQNLFGLT